MSQPFEVSLSQDRRTLQLRLTGFWSVDDLEAFRAARAAALNQLKCTPASFHSLVDLRKLDIQSQVLVHNFKDMLSDPVWRPSKAAVIVATSLARMQFRRIAKTETVKFFTDLEEAKEWLNA
jgi:hypothetical protein